MSLSEFLLSSEHLHDREAMLVHQLVYESRLAFAKIESRLQVLTGEVDHDGFDIVFDDGDMWKRFQIKTVFGSTSSWPIHKRLLRPTPELADYFGFESSPEGIGICGGVILQELTINKAGGLDVAYRYTDLFVLRALMLGIIEPDSLQSHEAVKSAWEQLKIGHGKIMLAKGLFLKANGVEGMLGLSGFNMGNCDPWLHWLKILSAHKAGFENHLPKNWKLPTNETGTIDLIRQNVAKLRSTS